MSGATPVLKANVMGAGDHTSTCIEVDGNTCAYFYGSSGSITDARTVLSTGVATKLATNWQQSLRDRGFPVASGHHQTQLRPGVLMTATIPSYLISVNAEDGGTITAPAVLGTASFAGAPDDPKRFTHGTEWARAGADSILLQGGETNFTGTCDPTAGAFSTFRVTGDPLTAPIFTFADQYRPVSGTYLDGNPPDGSYALGCSSHWFEPRQDFADGGVVALAAYESGTKFLDIAPDGKITEAGFFLPLGGATSAPHWAPDGKTVYLVDYKRGLDIVQFGEGVAVLDPVVPEFAAPAVLGLAAAVLLGVTVVARRRSLVR